MDTHKDNAKWLAYFAPFRMLSISAAYLTPFFLMNGLRMSQVFLLQSVFSVAYLLWEIPSGFVADKIGRARSIKLSVPIAAIAMIGYGLSHSFWQFAAWEVVLAIANGFISGADTALLMDSLIADGREEEFAKRSQRINAFGFLGTAAAVPLAFLLVHFVSVASTLVADGVLVLIGAPFAWKLVEAPYHGLNEEAERVRVWQAAAAMAKNVEARWLVALTVALSSATYFAFWLTAPYYSKLGIPAVWFGTILAVRSLWKAWLSHTFVLRKHLERAVSAFALIGLVVYLAMASGQLWLVWAVLGHDLIQSLQSEPISGVLNQHIAARYRATMNSAVNVVQRLTFAAGGPIIGFIVDTAGLRAGLTVTGCVCGAFGLIAVTRLRFLKTLQPARR